MAAIAALVLAQSANAALLAGFYDFIGDKAVVDPGSGISNETPETWMPGITAWMESPLQASQGSGGSFDGTYGPGPSTTDAGVIAGNMGVAQSPAVNISIGDGAATIRTIEGTFASTCTFFFRNDTTTDIPLAGLAFDIADISNTPVEKNRYTLSVILDTMMVEIVSNRSVGVTSDNHSYMNEMIDLTEYVLGAGETIGFEFKADITPGFQYPADTIWLDNVALLGIPEPSGVLGLGCVLASGLLLRNRRRN